jgi:hypothetical protein
LEKKLPRKPKKKAGAVAGRATHHHPPVTCTTPHIPQTPTNPQVPKTTPSKKVGIDNINAVQSKDLGFHRGRTRGAGEGGDHDKPPERETAPNIIAIVETGAVSQGFLLVTDGAWWCGVDVGVLYMTAQLETPREGLMSTATSLPSV